MPKDDINYRFTENEVVYDFYDVFVPAEIFREPSLWNWGRNTTSGQLGVNDIINRSTPVTTILGGSNWKFVFSSAAIKGDGTLWNWGSNTNGSLGVNDTIVRSTPVTTILGGNDWESVSGSSFHTIAIKTNGTLWTWGQNSDGQLGVNDTIARSTPVTTILGGNNWKSIGCGYSHIIAIKTDGTLWTWGNNADGQLGVNNTTNRNTPVTTILGGTNWISNIGKYQSTSGSSSAAIKTDGTLWAWGRNLEGQLGVNDTTTRSTPVTTILGGINWKYVSTMGSNISAMKTDGTLWTWGNNSYGQLGINDTTTRSTPVTTILGGTNWKSTNPGNRFSSAIKTDGTLWVWGRNENGQLGINDLTNRNTPVTTILGGNNWKSVRGGVSYTIAIKYEPDP